jgi:type IV pilus assembly protein PilM
MPLLEKVITVGLEMNGQILRAVCIEHSQDRPRLLALAQQRHSAELQGPLDIEGSVWRVLKYGRKAGRLVVNIPGAIVHIKKIQVETSELEYLRDWVRWEAQQYLPDPPDEYLIDHQKLKPVNDDLCDVLLVMARAEAVRNRIQLFRSAGLEPAVMDVDPLALQNAFEVNYPEILDLPVLLINIEEDFCTLVTTYRGVPERVHTFPAGDQMEPFLEQLNRALAQLRSRSGPDDEGQLQTGKALLSGGGSQFERVVQFLSSQSGIEIEFAEPFREIAVLPSLREKLDQSYRTSEFLLATGLALRKV